MSMRAFAKFCRVVLGLTFVFSGFVKCIDPWGTALKITEYLNVWGLPAGLSAGLLGEGDGGRIVLSIAMCAAELVLGLMLVFGVWRRLAALAALVAMSVFVVVTVLSATVLPVEECGCFGDAVRLTPWGSVAKNLVLLALAIVVWLAARGEGLPLWPKRPAEWLAVAVFTCVSVGLGVWCYRHLPLVDFLPYRVGVDLREARFGDPGANEEDEQGGDIRLREFTIFNAQGDGTWELLDDDGRTYVLVASRLSDITPSVEQGFERIVEQASKPATRNPATRNAGRRNRSGATLRPGRVILVTSSPLSEDETVRLGGPDAPPIEVFNLDATTALTMLRARTGVVVIDNGVVISKKQIRGG